MASGIAPIHVPTPLKVRRLMPVGAPIQMVMAWKTVLTNVRRPRQATRLIATGVPIRMVTVSRTVLTTAH